MTSTICNKIAEFFQEFLQCLCSPIIYALKKFFEWFLTVLFDNISPEAYAELENLIPDISDSMSGTSQLGQFMGFVNDWIPLEIGYSCLLIYAEYIITMITIKLAIKLFVPTLG